MRRCTRPFIVPVFIPHAGCPHRCAFCDQHLISGAGQPLPDNAALRSYIETFLGYRHPARRPVEISFYGGNFLGLAEEAMQRLLTVAQRFVDEGRVDHIRCSTRPDTVTVQRLNLLRPYALKTVELGVQSMDDRVLTAARRGHCARDTVAAVKRLRQYSMTIGLQLMIGLPRQDAASTMATAHRIIALHPDFVRIYPTLVLKGSLLDAWRRRGVYQPLTLPAAVQLVKQLYLVFTRQGIPVIRMGLQPSDSLAEDTGILAGPYHPAFGELVFSAVFFDRAVQEITAKGLRGRPVCLRVHPASVSKLRGLKSSNCRRLQERFALPSLRISPHADLPPLKLVAQCDVDAPA